MVAGARGFRHRDFAFGVERLLSADRRDDDRRVVAHAENLGAHVDLADVDQAARTQHEFQEAFAIGAQRDFIVDAGRHVAEMRRRNVGAADRLEIENVDRLLRALDQVLGLERRPHDGIGQLRARRRTLRRRPGSCRRAAGCRRGIAESGDGLWPDRFACASPRTSRIARMGARSTQKLRPRREEDEGPASPRAKS